MADIKIINLDDQIIENKMDKKSKIAVLCLPGLEAFLTDIVEYLKKDYDVRTCYSKMTPELEAAIAWADIVWLEWANELAIELTQKVAALENKKVIVRLHSYEALSGYVQKIKWSVVDVIIFVANHIKQFVLQQMPGFMNPMLNPPEMFVVPNGVKV